jgi:PAS domain S-box-containing protein
MKDATENQGQASVATTDDPLFTAIIESALDYAIITIDVRGNVTSWNPGAQALLGWSSEEMVGGNGDIIFTREDIERGAPEGERAKASRHGRAEDERWHVRKDGSRFWGSGLLVPLRGEGVSGFLKIMRDRTEQRRLQFALQESENRFRTLAEHIPQLVWRSRSMGERTWPSPQWIAYTGLSAEKSIGLGWVDAVHPQDRAATIEAWAEAELRGEYYVEHRFRRAVDGEYRWFQSRARRLTDSEGKTIEWFGTSADVHELRRLNERQNVLLKELHHRSRNLLSIVSSIARRTQALSQSLDEFGERFGARIAALARVQGLVAREDRAELELGELVRSEIAAHQADVNSKVRVEGPPVTLREKAAETLALALHELATNAVKYGALSDSSGQLVVKWRVRDDETLVVEWEETGVAPKADTRRGYGRELIEVALPLALGAQTKFDLGPRGVRCSIELPASETESRRSGKPNGVVPGEQEQERRSS